MLTLLTRVQPTTNFRTVQIKKMNCFRRSTHGLIAVPYTRAIFMKLRGEHKDLIPVHQLIITAILEQTQWSISKARGPAQHTSTFLHRKRHFAEENIKGGCITCSDRSESGGRKQMPWKCAECCVVVCLESCSPAFILLSV